MISLNLANRALEVRLLSIHARGRSPAWVQIMAQNDNQPSNDNDIERMVERKMSPNLADRGEVIDHLIRFSGYEEDDRGMLGDAPMMILDKLAEEEVPGARVTDRGLVIDSDPDPTANDMSNVDPEDFGSGEVAQTRRDTDSTLSANAVGWGGDGGDGEDDGPVDPEDFGTGIIKND